MGRRNGRKWEKSPWGRNIRIEWVACMQWEGLRQSCDFFWLNLSDKYLAACCPYFVPKGTVWLAFGCEFTNRLSPRGQIIGIPGISRTPKKPNKVALFALNAAFSRPYCGRGKQDNSLIRTALARALVEKIFREPGQCIWTETSLPEVCTNPARIGRAPVVPNGTGYVSAAAVVLTGTP
jgi:hypothetical protein